MDLKADLEYSRLGRGGLQVAERVCRDTGRGPPRSGMPKEGPEEEGSCGDEASGGHGAEGLPGWRVSSCACGQWARLT